MYRITFASRPTVGSPGFVLAFGLALSGLAGCQTGPVIPEAIPVTGSVTYNGQPVVGVAITFVNNDPKGKSGAGSTDNSGSFALKTYVDQTHILDGAIAGDYRVTVANFTRPSGDAPGVAAAAPKDESKIPEKYANAETSDFKVTVTKGIAPVVLELKD